MLGFGFNKTKVLASAERNVQQGKLQNAISDYRKVLKQEPNDLTVLNTVGDLSARLNQVEEATACFKQVADAYAESGFTVKAIAVYKKLSKLNAGTLEYLLKLADLYRLQGLYSDARSQYLQAADALLREGKTQEPARLFEKILEIDPENASVQSRLAELYLRASKNDEAAELLLRVAETSIRRGAFDGAEHALKTLITLKPQNPRVLEIRGRIALEHGNPAEAATYLEGIPAVQSTEPGLKNLATVYLQAGQLDKALAASEKLLTEFGDPQILILCCDRLIASQRVCDALRILDEFSDRLLDSPGMVEKLQACISKVREDPATLEKLNTLLEKAGDTTQSVDILELIAHACVQRGELARAKDLYHQLVELEPVNRVHLQNYNQVVARLQDAPVMQEEISPEEPASTAVDSSLHYPEELAEEIRTALAEAELFENYKAPVKAIEALEKVLQRAPHDLRLNKQLASLYPQVERFSEAAYCCEQLKQALSQEGERQGASQYDYLAVQYRAKAEAAKPPAPQPTEPSAASWEVDLTEEWERVAAEAHSATEESTSVEDIAEEIRFYLSESLSREAEFAIARLSEMKPEFSELPAFRRQLARITGDEPAEPPPSEDIPVADSPLEPAELPMEAPTELEAPLRELAAFGTAPIQEILLPPAAASGENVPPPDATTDAPMAAAENPSAPSTPATDIPVLNELMLDLDRVLGDDFAIGPEAAPAPASSSAPEAIPAAARELLDHNAPVKPIPAAPSAEAIPAASAGENSMLNDLFEEFKEQVEDHSSSDDPETHYSLALAFKDMGLIEEAIGEFQNVCQAIQRGQPFAHVIQTYTWLAQCLVERGAPEASYKWYQHALEAAPDEETRTAIHFELAQAYEGAGEKSEALKHYMLVYGSNINFRGVAERIKAMKS